MSHIDRILGGCVCVFSSDLNRVCVASLASGSCDPLNILDAICREKMSERAVADGNQASVSAHQPSEQGYLNLTSPSLLPGAKGSKGSSFNSDQV